MCVRFSVDGRRIKPASLHADTYNMKTTRALLAATLVCSASPIAALDIIMSSHKPADYSMMHTRHIERQRDTIIEIPSAR